MRVFGLYMINYVNKNELRNVNGTDTSDDIIYKAGN